MSTFVCNNPNCMNEIEDGSFMTCECKRGHFCSVKCANEDLSENHETWCGSIDFECGNVYFHMPSGSILRYFGKDTDLSLADCVQILCCAEDRNVKFVHKDDPTHEINSEMTYDDLINKNDRRKADVTVLFVN